MTEFLGFASGDKLDVEKPPILIGHCGRCQGELRPETITQIGNGNYCPECAAVIWKNITWQNK